MAVEQYYIDLMLYPGVHSTGPFILSVPSVMDACSRMVLRCYSQIAVGSLFFMPGCS